MLGQRVDGKYELIKVLGQGAMGVVYRARHAATGREVALKLVQPDKMVAPGALERFQREARAMGALADSQHVVQVLDAGADRDSGAAFMVMELLNGEDVEALAHRLGPLPVGLALRIVAQALRGLSPAHDAGIVHRDIKPSNLFLSKQADGERIVKVLDFGIVKMLDAASGPQAMDAAALSKLTKTGGTLGSPAYMSPEQVQGSKALDTRTDLWSMGVLLYQLLCGVLPFHELTELPQLLLAIYYRDPPPLTGRAPWVPPEVAAIVHRAMQRDVTARFAKAAEMREAIVRLLGGATAITESMLLPLSPEARSSQAPVSAMAVAMSVPAPLPSGTTKIEGFSPASAVLPASTAAPAEATGLPGAGAPFGTMPLSALPVSAGPSAAAPSIAVPPTLSAGASPSTPGAAMAPSAAATLASAGVVPRSAARRTIVLAAAGLLLAGALGAAAFAMITRSDAPPSGSSSVGLTASSTLAAASPPPTAATNAAAEAAPAVSTAVVSEPKPGEGADAGAPVPPSTSSAKSTAVGLPPKGGRTTITSSHAATPAAPTSATATPQKAKTID